MKKIKLEIETLEIESFEITPGAADHGTVLAHATAFDGPCSGFTYYETCPVNATCFPTCAAGCYFTQLCDSPYQTPACQTSYETC